jgi:hypothetical protein
MKKKDHILIGVVVFIAYNTLNNTIINFVFNPAIKLSFGSMMFYGGVLAVIGSLMPDIIEPALHWSHRSKFHSKKILKFFGGVFSITAIIGLFSPVFFLISCFFVGYVFHLIADSLTEVGLPEE